MVKACGPMGKEQEGTLPSAWLGLRQVETRRAPQFFARSPSATPRFASSKRGWILSQSQARRAQATEETQGFQVGRRVKSGRASRQAFNRGVHPTPPPDPIPSVCLSRRLGGILSPLPRAARAFLGVLAFPSVALSCRVFAFLGFRAFSGTRFGTCRGVF